MQYTFKQFQTEYPDEAACLEKIMLMKHGGTEIKCPACVRPSKFHKIAKRRAYACQHCGHHIYPCAGTPFEKSRTPLTNWFFAMYLMTSTRHGVAAKELERQIGVTYKTAWRMAHELRKLMAQADDHGPLSGHVEIDETYVGGKNTGEGRENRMDNKTVVFGMLERDRGIVRAGPVPNAKRKTLEPVIFQNVVRESTISSDENAAYAKLARDGRYYHVSINHAAKQWADGQHHTNGIEGYWSQIKRGIRGTHVHVSSKHMWKYVSEFSFRYNMRKLPNLMFDQLIYSLAWPRLKET